MEQNVYYRQNGAPITNNVHINAVRKQQLKDAIRNNRLGVYNAFGRYILSPKITKELFGITKYVYKNHYEQVIAESKDVFEFKATSNLPVFGNLEFRIVIKDADVKVYLIENVYREFNGYQEIYGELLSEFACQGDKDVVIDHVFALFNVKVVDENDYGKVEEEENVATILMHKLCCSMAARNYVRDSAPDEKEIFEEMVSMLKDEGGEYGKRVLRNFLDRIEKRPDLMQLKDEDGYNEALNDALLGALEVVTTEDDMLDPKIKELYEKLYEKRFNKTDEQIQEGQEKITEKDFHKVAEGVFGNKARIFDPDAVKGKLEELANIIEDIKKPPVNTEEQRESIDKLTAMVNGNDKTRVTAVPIIKQDTVVRAPTTEETRKVGQRPERVEIAETRAEDKLVRSKNKLSRPQPGKPGIGITMSSNPARSSNKSSPSKPVVKGGKAAKADKKAEQKGQGSGTKPYPRTQVDSTSNIERMFDNSYDPSKIAVGKSSSTKENGFENVIDPSRMREEASKNVVTEEEREIHKNLGPKITITKETGKTFDFNNFEMSAEEFKDLEDRLDNATSEEEEDMEEKVFRDSSITINPEEHLEEETPIEDLSAVSINAATGSMDDVYTISSQEDEGPVQGL